MPSDGEGEANRRHVPVLLREVLEVLDPRPGRIFLDGTVGLGGHAAAILSRLGDDGLLVGIDRDAEALEKARTRLAGIGGRFHLFRGLFTQLREALLEAGVDPEGGLDGILLDLGVSSYQLDEPARGFSFLRDGPLDMRMSPGEGVTAADWLETAAVEELEKVLREHGEEPAARKIARAIDRERRRRPIRTTGRLAGLIESVRPRAGGRIHPATRTFQAIRIHLNRELDHLRAFLAQADRYLRPRGRLAVLSYHSLEDRLVKNAIRGRVKEGIFESVRPEVIRPSAEEVRDNPRARSARLRWAVRRG